MDTWYCSFDLEKANEILLSKGSPKKMKIDEGSIWPYKNNSFSPERYGIVIELMKGVNLGTETVDRSRAKFDSKKIPTRSGKLQI